jgi:coenzyme PQQ synthesis protein D (PqqD)
MHEHYKINGPDVVSEEMADEVVIINLETGYFFNCNKTAALIWDLISEGLSCQQIFNCIAKDHGIEKEKATKDVEDLLMQFIKEALIVESDGDISIEKDINCSRDRKKVSEYQRPHIEKHSDIQEMLRLDPIHEVTEVGWPNKKE